MPTNKLKIKVGVKLLYKDSEESFPVVIIGRSTHANSKGCCANLESYVVLIEEWLQKQVETKEYWLNKGWPSVWEQFVKDKGLSY